MVFTADQIEQFVKELTELKNKFTIEEINGMSQFNDFKIQNRIFYEMIVSNDGVNQVVFKEMMKMKRRLETGEDQYSVDVRFGEFMAGKYIDPVVGKK